MSAERKKARWLKADLDKMRKVLQDKRDEILGVVSSLEDAALKPAEDEVSVDHMADHGSESYEKDQTIGLIEHENDSLRAINDALRKIGSSRFGICEECEEAIKKTRLKALPYARLCLDCQIAEEQGGQ